MASKLSRIMADSRKFADASVVKLVPTKKTRRNRDPALVPLYRRRPEAPGPGTSK
jgi:hypothetical protein